MSNQLASKIDAKTAHRRLRQALEAMREAECNAVTIFAEILLRGLFRELGYANIHIYASEALGFSRTKTYEFIRLAESLEKLPHLRTSLKSGEVPWTKASAIARVATPETENRWIEIAKTSSRRELEQQVVRSKAIRKAGKHESGQGELLTEKAAAKPAPPEAAPVQSVTIRLSPLQRAHYDALVEKLMKRHRRSRDEIILMALEAFLGGSEGFTQDAESAQGKEPGGCEETIQREKSSRLDSAATYQVIVYQCETCGAGAVGSERRQLSAAETAQVECDSKILEPGKRNRSSIPPARRRAVLLRDGHRCRVRGCDSPHFLEVHHLKSRRDGGSNREHNLVALCSSCHNHLHGRGGILPPLRKL